MTESPLGAARVFASHYQIVITDDPTSHAGDSGLWSDADVAHGYSGTPRFRMIGTEADLNDHWVTLAKANTKPDVSRWQRIICCPVETVTGQIHVMGLMDDTAAMSAVVTPGVLTAYVCVQNVGIDQQTTGELQAGTHVGLTDAEISARHDLERYHIVLVPGAPEQTGMLVDRVS